MVIEGGLSQLSSPVVLDAGSDAVRCGFAHDQGPRYVFPSVVGWTPKSQIQEDKEKFCYVGSESQNKAKMLNLTYPIQNGQISNFENIEKLFDHMYEELTISSKYQPVLMTQHILNSIKNKENTAQMMFENFEVPGLYLEFQNPLALYSSGHKTGVSIDAGHSGVTVVPVNDGVCVKEASKHTPVGGRVLTDYLADMYSRRGYDITLETVRQIKESLCYVSNDFSEEMQTGGCEFIFDKTYQLPDGQEVNIESERFYCPEGLFSPELLGVNKDGIHKIAHDSILQCHEILQKELFANILMTGGTSICKGFKERLFSELKKLAPKSHPMSKINPDFRNRTATNITDTKTKEGYAMNAVWIGGSILVSLNDFQHMWITKQEYEEKGSYIISKRC
ncbi:unnamed protein product [Meganyctiphanes norvegica]|uniref:Actin n=1 Tax=Meganyctiphanes norvegica TaxID=48144 RepID=A0AAV2RSJ8_MEGNR